MRHYRGIDAVLFRSERSMLLSVRLDLRAPRLWHLRLLESLGSHPGVDVVVEHAESVPVQPNMRWLLALEARLHRLSPSSLAAPVAAGSLDRYRRDGAAPDLVIALCGTPKATDGRVWTLTFDGRVGEPSLLDAILRGGAPIAALHEGDAIVAAARLGTESIGIVQAAFGDMLARTVTLVAGALRGAAPRLPAGLLPTCQNAPALSPAAFGILAGRSVVRRIARRGGRLIYRSPHWRTGWRKLDGPDLFDLRQHPEAGWRDLPDDGDRFYADPFPFVNEGQLTLFVEEYPHETGKGIISAVRFDDDGPVGTPEPVLDLPYHLSYPFVFEREGAIWMIPESGAAGTIDLYRSTRYPAGWVKEATLVSDLVAGDATLCEWDGRWWMFATVKDGGCYSDALHLWSAPDFRGPWTPHARNPVLIDIASARPAGRMVVRDGALYRPVQDCRDGYGAALGIARVTRLDQEDFDQTVETVLTAGPRWPGGHLHTLNQAGGFEFIDGSGFARRPWLRRGPARRS